MPPVVPLRSCPQYDYFDLRGGNNVVTETKRIEDMSEEEILEGLAKKRQSKGIDKPESSGIMTSERGEPNDNDRRERPSDTKRESSGLSSQQQAEVIQGNDQEGTQRIRREESEEGERVRRESNVERNIGTGSVEPGDSSGDTGERERLEQVVAPAKP